MVLNKLGELANKFWLEITEHFDGVELDEYIIMPNHVHGIVIINHNDVGNGRDDSLHKIKPLSELIGAFKIRSSKLIHQAGLMDFKWQKSFYDHISRNESSLSKIRIYIRNNPLE